MGRNSISHQTSKLLAMLQIAHLSLSLLEYSSSNTTFCSWYYSTDICQTLALLWTTLNLTKLNFPENSVSFQGLLTDNWLDFKAEFDKQHLLVIIQINPLDWPRNERYLQTSPLTYRAQPPIQTLHENDSYTSTIALVCRVLLTRLSTLNYIWLPKFTNTCYNIPYK